MLAVNQIVHSNAPDAVTGAPYRILQIGLTQAQLELDKQLASELMPSEPIIWAAFDRIQPAIYLGDYLKTPDGTFKTLVHIRYGEEKAYGVLVNGVKRWYSLNEISSVTKTIPAEKIQWHSLDSGKTYRLGRTLVLGGQAETLRAAKCDHRGCE